METNQIEKEYTRVKRSLEVLGYKGPLGIESVGVVNKILNDLIKTTDAFKKLQDERDKIKADLKVQGDLLLPLRRENFKLTSENNQLHKDIIQLKDDIEHEHNRTANQISTLEKEKEDLKFLLTQKDTKINKLTADVERTRNEYNLVLNNVNHNPNVNMTDKRTFMGNSMTGSSMSGSRNQNPTFELSSKMNAPVKENMNKDEILNLMRQEMSTQNLSKEDWANDLKIAGKEAEKLRNEIKNLKQTLKEKEKSVEDMAQKLSSRDAEILRLQTTNYVGDDNKEELKLRYNADSLMEQNEKLKTQIDFLNKENHDLHEIDYFHNHRCRQEEINKLDDTIAKLKSENEKLKKNLEREREINAEGSVTNSSLLMSGTGSDKKLTKANLKAQIQSLNDQVQSLKNLNSSLESDLNQVRTNYKQTMDKLKQEEDEFNTKISELNSQKNALNKKFEDIQMENLNLKNQTDNRSTEVKGYQDMIEELKSELNLYKSNELLSNKNLEEKNDAVKKILVLGIAMEVQVPS
ncbi:MAG: hypothetical protein MJ252_13255 [archaeon]|nr:hypothetical protein [archaeon]